MQQRLWRGASDEDVRAPDGGARGWWGANPSSSRGSAGDAARDGRRPLRARRDDDDDRSELSSGGESDDSRATVVTHGVGAHHGKSLSGVSSSGGDFASASDAERGDGELGRGRGVTSHSRLGSNVIGSNAARLSHTQSFGGGELRPLAGSDSVLRRVDSKTHVVEALASVPGLHKRGIDLPMTKRLAFRKCRGVTRGKTGLLALLLMLFVVAASSRRRAFPTTRKFPDAFSENAGATSSFAASARRFGPRRDVRAFGSKETGVGGNSVGRDAVQAGDEARFVWDFGTGRGG